MSKHLPPSAQRKAGGGERPGANHEALAVVLDFSLESRSAMICGQELETPARRAMTQRPRLRCAAQFIEPERRDIRVRFDERRAKTYCTA